MNRGHTAARVIAALAAVFWGFLWFGLIDLLVVWEQDERFHDHYLLESGWGLLYLVVVAVPLVLLAMRAGDEVALAQLVVATLAVLAGAPVGSRAAPAVERSRSRAHGRTAGVTRPSASAELASAGRGLCLLAIVGLVPAMLYGAPLARNTTDVEDLTNGVSHYPVKASLALAVVGLVALAAVTRSRLPAWTAAFSACWLGLESILYPGLKGSLGATRGALTTAWGVLVVVSLEVAPRRTRSVD